MMKINKNWRAFLSGFVLAIIIDASLIYMYLHNPRANEEKYPSFTVSANAKALPYYEVHIWDNCYKKPKQMRVKIILDSAVKTYRSDDLCATCMAAAKYYSLKNGSIPTQIKVYNSIPEARYKRYRLAECAYSPSGKGWNIKQDENWTWNRVLVNPEDRLSPVNEARRIEAEIHQDFPDEHERVKKISEMLNIDFKTVRAAIWSERNMLEANYKAIQDITPEAPLSPNPELLSQNNAKIQLETAKLYKELESFWDKQASFQEKSLAWTKGPALQWNQNIESLWENVQDYYPVTHEIMCLPWDVDTLEWRYVHDENKKAEALRELIKERMAMPPSQGK